PLPVSVRGEHPSHFGGLPYVFPESRGAVAGLELTRRTLTPGTGSVTVHVPRKWSILLHLFFRAFHSDADRRLEVRGDGLAGRANRRVGARACAEGCRARPTGR